MKKAKKTAAGPCTPAALQASGRALAQLEDWRAKRHSRRETLVPFRLGEGPQKGMENFLAGVSARFPARRDVAVDAIVRRSPIHPLAPIQRPLAMVSAGQSLPPLTDVPFNPRGIASKVQIVSRQHRRLSAESLDLALSITA
jgi:hypothetical protein